MIGVQLAGTSFFHSHSTDRSSLPLSLKELQQQLLLIFLKNKIICCHLNTQFRVKEPFLFEWHFPSRWCGGKIQLRIARTPRQSLTGALQNDSLSNIKCKHFILPLILIFILSLTKVHSLEACFYVQFFFKPKNSSINSADCESTSCYSQTIETPWECECMWLDFLIGLESTNSDFQSQSFEWNASVLRMRSLLNMGLAYSRGLVLGEGGQTHRDAPMDAVAIWPP